MNHDPFTPAPGGCDAVQAQLSELADSGAPLTPALQTHLDGCAACARFAEQWLAGPPAGLAGPVSAVPDAALRERILDAAARPNIVPFRPTTAARPTWTTWLGRVAACLALVGLAYWLMNPAVSTVRPRRVVAAATTLGQKFKQVEDRSRREREVLQTAVVDGGSHVRGNVMWSVSALDL